MLNWGNIDDSTTVVEGSVLLVQWLIQQGVCSAPVSII